jgi:hypothetical protein
VPDIDQPQALRLQEAVEWDPVALGRKPAFRRRSSGKAGHADRRVFATILPELARRGVQVIILIDEGQLPPFEFGNKDAPPTAYLREE